MVLAVRIVAQNHFRQSEFRVRNDLFQRVKEILAEGVPDTALAMVVSEDISENILEFLDRKEGKEEFLDFCLIPLPTAYVLAEKLLKQVPSC